MMIPSTRRISVVVDASALVDAILGNSDIAATLLRHDLHAPVSVDAEVLHALRRKWLAKRISEDHALGALDGFHAIAITRHPVQSFVDRMWSFRHNITAYDAAYVALAESLRIPLLTRDARLSRASGHTATIEYIA